MISPRKHVLSAAAALVAGLTIAAVPASAERQTASASATKNVTVGDSMKATVSVR